MNIYRISQSVNSGYNTYDLAVVLAETADEARCTHPSDARQWDAKVGKWYMLFAHTGDKRHYDESFCDTWAPVGDVKAVLLGAADARFETMNAGQSRVICASFNAE